MKYVTTKNDWSSEVGPEKGIDIPFHVIVRFQKKDRIAHEALNND